MFKILLFVSAFIAIAYADSNPEDVEATILTNEYAINPDGRYSYEYLTSNGIQAQESGLSGSYATGSFSYSSPEGEAIQLEYTADENGFQPRGEHLPTPPPIPDYILRALEYIESHPYTSEEFTKK